MVTRRQPLKTVKRRSEIVEEGKDIIVDGEVLESMPEEQAAVKKPVVEPVAPKQEMPKEKQWVCERVGRTAQWVRR